MQFRADLRYAVRQLARSPGFTAIAAITLALGIGVNSALYTLTDAIIRRPRPGVSESETLIWIAATSRERSRPTGISYQDADRLRREIPLLENVATIREMPLSLVTGSEPIEVTGQAVSGDYFAMLRTQFALGRGFTLAEDSAAAAHPVAVLSHHAWRTHFGSDPSIIGRSIAVNGMSLTVIGVTAEGFNGAEHDDVRAIWVPSSLLGVLLPEWRWMTTSAAGTNIRAMARLRASGDREQVAAAARRVATLISAQDTARAAGWTLNVYDASAGLPAGAQTAIRPVAMLSFAVTGLILLICCANVSNLMLARALARQREIATRLSIGASRSRVVRQLLTEALLLSSVATAAGLVLAKWSTELLLAFALPLPLDVSVDWRVFVVSAVIAMITAVMFGLAPALHATREGVATVLRESGTGGTRRRSRLQGSLVVAQVALSLTMLTMSGLFLRSLDKARRLDVGFDASNRVLAASYDLGLQRYDSARAAQFNASVIERVAALPGVQSVSSTSLLPLTEETSTSVIVARDSAGPTRTRASYSIILPEYFRTVGTTLVAGRDFARSDERGAQLVAIVSAEFARLHIKRAGAAALGARISMDGENGPWRTVVGVADNAAVQALSADPMGSIYLPAGQRHSNQVNLLVRTAGGDAARLAPAVRDIVRELEPALPMRGLMTLDRVRDEAMSAQRMGATILAIFGGLALLVATVGLSGALLFAVRQRTREIGIRMALGATRAGVVSLFVRRGMRLTLIGVGIGVVLALAATQLTRSLLHGVSPTDGFTFAAVAVLFALVALVASWIPARRAAQVDPVKAMRAD